MDYCAKCGKELGFLTKHKIGGSDIASFENALRRGLFSEYRGKEICASCQHELLHSKGIKYRGIIGIRQGKARIEELAKEIKNISLEPSKQIMCSNCAFSSKFTFQEEKASLTNLMGAVTGAGIMDYQYLDKWNCSKFKFDVTDRLTLADNCSSYITQSDYEKKCLSGEMEKDKANVQIILDFSSLKDAMSKGGLVMSTYKCPNCNGMVDIPEAGKVLVCKYCSTPIKPVDIFEKIRTLIQ